MKSEVCYLAQSLSILCGEHHLSRVQDGKGLPTDEEIKKLKEELDKVFKKTYES